MSATIPQIFDSLASGDRGAEAAIGETARLLVLAISAVQAVTDPELIVLGGSIGMQRMVERVRTMLPLSAPRHVPTRQCPRQTVRHWWVRWEKRSSITSRVVRR